MRILLLLIVCTVAVAPQVAAANWALEFDGVDDYAVIHDWAIVYDELTVEAWVLFLEGGTPDLAYEIVGAHDPTSGLAFQLEGTTGLVRFDPADDDCRTTCGYSFGYGEWHHIAATYDVSGVRIFVDGDELAHSGCYTGGLAAAAVNVLIGKEVPESMNHQYWRGYIDEVRVWTVARTPSQIVASMHIELEGNEPGLHGYWDFNEGAGQIAHDSSSNGGDAQLGSSPDADDSDPDWVFVDSPVPVQSTSWGTVKGLYR